MKERKFDNLLNDAISNNNDLIKYELERECEKIYNIAYSNHKAFDISTYRLKDSYNISIKFYDTNTFESRWFKSELTKLFSKVKITSSKYSGWFNSSSLEYEYVISKPLFTN